MNIETIGEMIHFHRKKAKLSRIELADLAGMSKTVVYDIEMGKETIQFKSLQKVLDVLNIHIDFKSPFINEFKQHKNETSIG